MVYTKPLFVAILITVNISKLRLWSEKRGSEVIQFKVTVVDSRLFAFDAWVVESGAHVGVHSPHLHRPYFHLQVKKAAEQGHSYRELPMGKALRYYAQTFEAAVRKVFGVNAWKVFS